MIIMEEIYEIRIRKTNTLTAKQFGEIQKQLDNISGEFDYVGYSRISYAVDKNKSSRDNLVLKIVKIEPIEGTVRDEHTRVREGIGDIFADEKK